MTMVLAARRAASFTQGMSFADDDPGVFREIALVNRIRKRAAAWCASGHPGGTGITR